MRNQDTNSVRAYWRYNGVDVPETPSGYTISQATRLRCESQRRQNMRNGMVRRLALRERQHRIEVTKLKKARITARKASKALQARVNTLPYAVALECAPAVTELTGLVVAQRDLEKNARLSKLTGLL